MAIGDSAFGAGSGGTNNTIVGRLAGTNGGLGSGNVALGTQALYNSYGNYLTAIGKGALFEATNAGLASTAVGFQAGYNVTSGGYNVFLGSFVSASGGITSGSNNIVIGKDPTLLTPTTSNQLDMGNLIFATGLGEGSTLSTGAVGIGVVAPTQTLEVNGGVRLNTSTSKPTCDSTQRGTFWVTESGAGVKDAVEVCAKDAANAYAWRTIY